VNRGDRLVERGADKLQQLSETMAARGGPAAQLASELQEDAAFLRKLKPSLIKARARGGGPREGRTDESEQKTEVKAPAGPQLSKRPKAPGSGPNPFVVIGAALVVGIVLAKVIDWRGHAHPRW